MGFGVQIFSVDWPYITSRVGSRDRYILERVRPDLMDVWDPADFEPDEVMPPEALDRLLEGRVPKGEVGGDAYYIAVLGIYRRFGLFVGNLALASDGIAFLKAVEDALTSCWCQGASEPWQPSLPRRALRAP